MLRTVKDACQLHPMALAYVMGEQIENLSDGIERTAADAREFFDKNFVSQFATKGKPIRVMELETVQVSDLTLIPAEN